jgi:2'-5' RNA ligase
MNEQEKRRDDAETQRRGEKKRRGDTATRACGEGKRNGDAGTQRRDEEKQRGEGEAVAVSPRPHVSASRPWRLFCAIELSEEIRTRAAEHIARLRSALPRVRAGWERPEKLHLTLKFLGDVEQSRVPALSLAAERAASSVAPFTLTIADAGAFPTHGPARVLWLGLRDSSGSLTRLQQSLEDECAAAGFKREGRSFHPHLTLARLRQPTGARTLAAQHQELGFQAMELNVSKIALLRSELGPHGSRYTMLSQHSLTSRGRE